MRWMRARGASRLNSSAAAAELIRVADDGSRHRCVRHCAGAGPACHQQDCLAEGPGTCVDLGISRRSAAEHRLRFALVAGIAHRPGSACLGHRCARRRGQRAGAGLARRGNHASRCGICSSMCRRGASSCAPRTPNTSTSCACWSAWRCRASTWRLRSCHNGKNVWTLRGGARAALQRLERVARICGEEFAAHVIELRHETESLTARVGWHCRPFRAARRTCNSPL